MSVTAYQGGVWSVSNTPTGTQNVAVTNSPTVVVSGTPAVTISGTVTTTTPASAGFLAPSRVSRFAITSDVRFYHFAYTAPGSTNSTTANTANPASTHLATIGSQVPTGTYAVRHRCYLVCVNSSGVLETIAVSAALNGGVPPGSSGVNNTTTRIMSYSSDPACSLPCGMSAIMAIGQTGTDSSSSESRIVLTSGNLDITVDSSCTALNQTYYVSGEVQLIGIA